MSGGDDWQVGDLALCVRGGSMGQVPEDARGWPVQGRIYRVVDVVTIEFMDGPDLALEIEGGPINNWDLPLWWHGRFRKVTPDAIDRDDAEVIAALTGEAVTA